MSFSIKYRFRERHDFWSKFNYFKDSKNFYREIQFHENIEFDEQEYGLIDHFDLQDFREQWDKNKWF